MLFIYAAVLLAVVCEPHCWHPCTELNGDVHHECGTCSPEYSCSPGTATWPTSPTVARVGEKPMEVLCTAMVVQYQMTQAWGR